VAGVAGSAVGEAAAGGGDNEFAGEVLFSHQMVRINKAAIPVSVRPMSSSITLSESAPRSNYMIYCVATLLTAVLIGPQRSFAYDSSERVFPTPRAAVDALIAAAKAGDPMTAIMPILGPDAEKILSSGDPVEDKNARQRFISAYDQMHRLAYDTDGSVVLYVGADNWPLPIPLVKKDNGWLFDTAVGEKEMVYRRIGANELYTIDVLENLVQAQNEYAEHARARSGVAQYAQRILSDDGQRNGLYWPAAAGEPPSPIGPLIAKAVAEGYKRGQGGQPVPFHGYIYRVLTKQGKNAPGGARSYLRDGRMTGGFAFLAYPASYRSSGVMTFLVNQSDNVLQKDLGPDTAKLAQEMTRYDPDSSWQEAAPGGIQPQETPPEETQPTAGPAHAAAQ
jgi:hypothetical protein